MESDREVRLGNLYAFSGRRRIGWQEPRHRGVVPVSCRVPRRSSDAPGLKCKRWIPLGAGHEFFHAAGRSLNPTGIVQSYRRPSSRFTRYGAGSVPCPRPLLSPWSGDPAWFLHGRWQRGMRAPRWRRFTAILSVHVLCGGPIRFLACSVPEKHRGISHNRITCGVSHVGRSFSCEN